MSAVQYWLEYDGSLMIRLDERFVLARACKDLLYYYALPSRDRDGLQTRVKKQMSLHPGGTLQMVGREGQRVATRGRS